MSVEYKEIYKRALSIYGEKNQVVMVFEEMSELQKALTKHLRGVCDKRTIADEIADVEIMLEQMKLLFSLENEVEERKQFKIERLMTRLDQKQSEIENKVCRVNGAPCCECKSVCGDWKVQK